MAEEEGKTEEGSEEAKPKSKKKLFIIVGVLVVLLGAGIAFPLLSGGSKEEGAEIEVEEEHKHYSVVELDTIIVNLSENSSFLKIKMAIEYDPSVLDLAQSHGGGGGHGGGGAGGGGEGGGLHPYLVEKDAQVKDAIIAVMSAKSPSEVLTPEGKEELKEELIEAINEALEVDEPAVVNVYFKEFIVQ